MPHQLWAEVLFDTNLFLTISLYIVLIFKLHLLRFSFSTSLWIMLLILLLFVSRFYYVVFSFYFAKTKCINLPSSVPVPLCFWIKLWLFIVYKMRSLFKISLFHSHLEKKNMNWFFEKIVFSAISLLRHGRPHKFYWNTLYMPKWDFSNVCCNCITDRSSSSLKYSPNLRIFFWFLLIPIHAKLKWNSVNFWKHFVSWIFTHISWLKWVRIFNRRSKTRHWPLNHVYWVSFEFWATQVLSAPTD